jgi:HSP20 family protein
MYDLVTFQDDLFSRMSEEFADIFTNRAGGLLPRLKKSGYPKVNVYNTDKDTVIEATVPGLTKDNVSVEWKDNILTIHSKTESKEETSNRNYYLREIHQSSFSRSFEVDDTNYKVDSISAKVDNGILNITLPLQKQLESKPKTQIVNVQ